MFRLSLALFAVALALSAIVQCYPMATSGNKDSSLHERSPSPRMIPGSNDLLSDMLARIGIQHFDKLNSMDHTDSYDDPAVIDDSNSTNATKTDHENSANQNADVSGGDHGLPDPTKNLYGFFDTLYKSLAHKFRTALDSSDEITLR